MFLWIHIPFITVIPALGKWTWPQNYIDVVRLQFPCDGNQQQRTLEGSRVADPDGLTSVAIKVYSTNAWPFI